MSNGSMGWSTPSRYYSYAQIIGIQDLLKLLENCGDRVPRQALAKGTRKGANAILNEAKGLAPVYTGTLQHSLKLKTEKGNTRKLKVAIDVIFDPAYSYYFLSKPIHPGIYGGTPNSSGLYYYPASQEYGFKTKYGYKPGEYFLREARDNNDEAFAMILEDALWAEIDRLG